MFKVAVTIQTKEAHPHILQNKMHLHLQGEKTDLINLQAELDEVKKIANEEANRNNLKLKNCNIIIEFIN